MNNFYKLLRCAVLMFLMSAWMMPAMAQHPFTLTTQAQHEAHSGEALYWIESNGATGFYAIPHTNNSNVSTTNMPNIKALWYFMDAGIENDIQYYYIVNHRTGNYLKLDGTLGNDNTIKLADFNSGGDAFKFSIGGSEGQWVLYPKNGNGNYWVNKKGGNVSYSNYFKSSNYGSSPDANSKWSFVAKNSVTWAHPFTNSAPGDKHYYLIRNRHKDYTSFYMSTDAASYVTVSNVEDDNRIWYFVEASSDAEIPNMKYYYIINAETGKYMYYDGNYSGTVLQSDKFKIQTHSGGNDDIYQFAIVNAKGNTYSAYSIMPKKLIGLYEDKYTSLGSTTMSNNERTDTQKDRGSEDNTAHWVFVETAYFAVKTPTITNNFDGTISMSTTTTGATIYYTTNGDDPSNTSTAYSSPFALGDASVIKAIAYLESDFSGVSTYNVPQCAEPTISFNSTTSQVTINDLTDGATIYYTIDKSTPTTTSTSYSTPFTVASGTTVKAIATHPGYLNSDVATKYFLGNNYSQNYLTFEVLTGGVIPWKSIGSMAKEISYRINGGEWAAITAGNNVKISVVAGDIVELKGSNSNYATASNEYSGFNADNENNAATYDISGNIMSLIYGDNFVGKTELSGTYNFCSLFKQSKAVSAENLILPATSLTNHCYRAMFSKCTTLEAAPALPATTLAENCYYYMFEKCAIATAPELPAPTLANNCYAYMFTDCTSLNYIKCLAENISASGCLTNWVNNVSPTGVFIKDRDATWTTGISGIPSDWTQYNEFYLYIPEISCDGEYITISCATEGASLYYRLNQTGEFSLYSPPIVFNSNTTVEAYSSKEDNTSAIVTNTFEKYDNPFDESTRSLDSWTYDNTQVTLPYSVNGIDGHSSNYSKGIFTFETSINLYKIQPTYLWFQHADQSADIYVDNNFVTTHWGGYNAFFVDISDYIHQGTNNIKVVLNNKTRDALAPAAGDFNFNATLGKAKLLTSPVMPPMDYGYDGMHITSSVTDESATINIKTSIPEGATVICKIDADDEDYHFTDTKPSTGSDMTFTTTIPNPHLWNGTEDPFLYNVTLEIYKDEELYHRFQRPYGFRYYEYDSSIGFLLNGQPYLLRGVCAHHDLEGKANALNDDDIANDFAIIKELGCNFLRLAHYPHPKEVYDWCDRLGIIVQTEVPCVNKFQSTMPDDYYTHLGMQYADMVNQHYNHPCILFWGLGNEITTNDAATAKTRLEAYRTQIKTLDPERWVGYVVSHSYSNPSSMFNNPNMDWFGCNIYVGWYINNGTNGELLNDPTNQLNSRKTNIITNLHKPLAFSEYGCGGTQQCHSDDPQTTTTKGNYERHDIEYQMWLHEGHIAAIKEFPELLFTAQWQLFDLAVSSRNEGYTICLDGEHASTDDNLRYLNNKGLVERDHKTKKDTYYLYKAWWNQKDKFVHICGKDYEKITGRAIKCYTNDGSELTLFVNNVEIETVAVTDNIATFTARDFNANDVIRVNGATTHDAFTLTNDFIIDGNWNVAANWRCNAVPSVGSDVVIRAECTIPYGVVVQADNITIGENGSLTIADGGQLILPNSTSVPATVQKSTTASEAKTSNAWYAIASPVDGAAISRFVHGTHNIYRYDETEAQWEEYRDESNLYTTLTNGRGYLYRSTAANIEFTGNVNVGSFTFDSSDEDHPLTYTAAIGKLKGFNLLGNPFTHDITWSNLTTKTNISDAGFYLLDVNDGWSATPTTEGSIAPMQGFLVQATAASPVVTISNTAAAKGMQANHDDIMFKVENSKYSDVTYAIFDKGYGLSKIGHRNADIPMIYISQDGNDFAIAMMDDGTQAFNLNFEAKTTGCYTLSFKANGEFNYLHVIDRLTGEDIDMILEGEYSFIGSPMDNASRFIVRLGYLPNYDDNGEDIFAYQSGSDVVVSGEGELQIFDAMGRMIATQRINGVETINVNAQGVYIFRLVGSEIKTQKIVVR